MDNSLLSISPR